MLKDRPPNCYCMACVISPNCLLGPLQGYIVTGYSQNPYKSEIMSVFWKCLIILLILNVTFEEINNIFDHPQYGP